MLFSSETREVPTETWSPKPRSFRPQMYLVTAADKTMESTREAVPDLTEQMGNHFRSGKCCGGRAGRDTPPSVEKGGEHSHDFHSCNMHGISFQIKDISRWLFF